MVHQIHVTFDIVIGYYGLDYIHINRVTLWYRTTTWQQKECFFSPLILAVLLLDDIGYDGNEDIHMPRVTGNRKFGLFLHLGPSLSWLYLAVFSLLKKKGKKEKDIIFMSSPMTEEGLTLQTEGFTIYHLLQHKEIKI